MKIEDIHRLHTAAMAFGQIALAAPTLHEREQAFDLSKLIHEAADELSLHLARDKEDAAQDSSLPKQTVILSANATTLIDR